MTDERNQLDLFAWADSRPSAAVIDIGPTLLHRAENGLIVFQTRTRPGDIVDMKTRSRLDFEPVPDVALKPPANGGEAIMGNSHDDQLVPFPLGRRIARARDVVAKMSKRKSQADFDRYLDQVQKGLRQQLGGIGFSDDVIEREIACFFNLVEEEADKRMRAMDAVAALLAAREREDDR